MNNFINQTFLYYNNAVLSNIMHANVKYTSYKKYTNTIAAEIFDSFENQRTVGSATTAANKAANSAAAGALMPSISRVPNRSGSCKKASVAMQQKQRMPLYLAFSSATRVSEYIIPTAAPSSGNPKSCNM